MSVNRCICHNISFREIKDIAGQCNFHSLEQLREEGVCSTQCRLCEPYIRKMLQTGQTSFDPVLLPKRNLKR